MNSNKTLLCTAVAAAISPAVNASQEQPNILLIVGDDVGFADTTPMAPRLIHRTWLNWQKKGSNSPIFTPRQHHR